MAIATVEGVYLESELKTKIFEGNTTTFIMIDIFQSGSEQNDKNVQIKVTDVGLYDYLKSNFAMGSLFKAKVSINSYQNKSYFKLIEIISE